MWICICSNSTTTTTAITSCSTSGHHHRGVSQFASVYFLCIWYDLSLWRVRSTHGLNTEGNMGDCMYHPSMFLSFVGYNFVTSVKKGGII
mmetsp:Transcript_40995/g.45802  ORF Transcript_40995/g.45802 Transcript_40995/m.45802 type:complete len:90 (+) Transcript_40995:112-381(+)